MSPNLDDDFIFTISDHDDVSDDGGNDEAASAKLAGAGKKRKYTEDPDLHSLERGGRSVFW
jgi:ATP-dependent RNA helicase DDX27